MKTHFTILFRLEVFHTYFAGQLCNCLQFIPDAETKQLQKRFGILIRKNINGFTLYADTQQPVAGYLQYISQATGKTCFDFRIESGNDTFSTFTELPVDWLGQLIYNSSDDLGTTDNDVVRLNEKLTENGTGPGVGKLTIHFKDILKWQQEPGNAVFAIHLNARATQWQYFVINKSNVQLSNPQINGSDEIGFEEPLQVAIESGEEALLFSSGKNLIALSELPKYRFALINQDTPVNEGIPKKTQARIIRKGLPNPSLKQSGIVNINGIKHLSSPMYVYV